MTQNRLNSGVGATVDNLLLTGRLRSGAELTGCLGETISARQRGRWTTFTDSDAAIEPVLREEV